MRVRLFNLCLFILLLFSGHAKERPNVLFLAVDDMNDWIGCLGKTPRAITPNIDKLAKSGVNFTNAHTAGADAAATLLLLHKMMDAHPQHFRRAVEDIRDWAYESTRGDKESDGLGPNLEDLEPVSGSHGWLRFSGTGIVIGRGRNRGRTITALEREDAPYLNWLSSSAGPLEAEAIQALLSERS